MFWGITRQMALRNLVVALIMLKSYLGCPLRSLIALLSPLGLWTCLVPSDRPRGELYRSGLGRVGRLWVRTPGSKKEVALVSFSLRSHFLIRRD